LLLSAVGDIDSASAAARKLRCSATAIAALISVNPPPSTVRNIGMVRPDLNA